MLGGVGAGRAILPATRLGTSFIRFAARRPFEIAIPEPYDQGNQKAHDCKWLKILNPAIDAKLDVRAVNDEPMIDNHPVYVTATLIRCGRQI